MSVGSAQSKSFIERATRAVYQTYKSTHTIVGFAASLVGLGSLAVWGVGLFSEENAQWLQAAFVCSAGSGALVLAFYMQYRFFQERQLGARAKAFSLALPDLVAVLAHARDAAACAAEDGDHDKLRDEGTYAVQKVAAMFSALTGSACRATIKQLHALDGTDDAAVKDLFRSEAPDPNRRHPDVDRVSDNTDFEEVMKTGLQPWVSGDILEERGYKNSHLSREDLKAGRVPYRSVLVVAISGTDKSNQTDVRGFLCVDSPNPGIFEDRPDVSAAKACAHAFYSILTWFHSRSDTSQEATA